MNGFNLWTLKLLTHLFHPLYTLNVQEELKKRGRQLLPSSFQMAPIWGGTMDIKSDTLSFMILCFKNRNNEVEDTMWSLRLFSESVFSLIGSDLLLRS